MRITGIWFVAMLAAMTVFLLYVPAEAQESSGWKFPNLNPFRSRQEPTRGMGELSDSPPREGWKFPSLPKPSLPRFGRRSDVEPMQPLGGPALEPPANAPPVASSRFQPLQAINSGARGFFSTARNTVTRPFRKNRDERPPTSAPATRPGPPGSFFRRAPEVETPEPQKEIRNANDFLKLPRVR